MRPVDHKLAAPAPGRKGHPLVAVSFKRGVAASDSLLTQGMRAPGIWPVIVFWLKVWEVPNGFGVQTLVPCAL